MNNKAAQRKLSGFLILCASAKYCGFGCVVQQRKTQPANEKTVVNQKFTTVFRFGGVDGTRTRDPRRDRPVF
jgi:hypothetical protein